MNKQLYVFRPRFKSGLFVRRLLAVNGVIVLLVVEGLEHGVALEEYPLLEEVGYRLGELVLGKDWDWDTEDLIQFFESTLLGFAGEGVKWVGR